MKIKPYIDIVKLVWPLALGMVNTAVMQFADRSYLATHSQDALAAVLPAGMLMWIFAGFFQSVVGYSSVFVAQFHGEGCPARCREAYRGALSLALAAGLLSLPLIPLGDWILALTTEDAALLDGKRGYYGILMAGSIFAYGQMAAAAYFTGLGRTRIVFWANLLGNALNVALDPLLIFGCDCGLLAIRPMGIAGAACASLVAMAVQMAMLTFAAERAVRRVPPAKECRADIVRRILRFGVPSGFFTVLNLASFAIFVFVTEHVGETDAERKLALAVSNACFTVNYLLFAPMEGFSLGASTLVAQAIGRGDRDEASRAARRTLILGTGFVAVVSTLTLLFADNILDIFDEAANDDVAAFHAMGLDLMSLMSAWLLFDAADVILGGALKGAGDTKFVMTWALVCSFCVWLPLVFAVRHFHNTMPALWSTMILYVLVVCTGSAIRWRRGAWRRIQLT